MSNLNRVLSLVVKITDPDKAKWIWDLHIRDNSPLNKELGVTICGISEGDLIAKNIELEDLLGDQPND